MFIALKQESPPSSLGGSQHELNVMSKSAHVTGDMIASQETNDGKGHKRGSSYESALFSIRPTGGPLMPDEMQLINDTNGAYAPIGLIRPVNLPIPTASHVGIADLGKE